MKRRLLSIFLVFAGAFSVVEPAFSQAFTFSGGRTEATMRFQFIQNLIIIPLHIGEQGPFNFILDSGVGPLIITDSTLVDSLHKKDASVYRIRGRGIGPEIEAYRVEKVPVRLGQHSQGHLNAVILKNEPFRLSFFLGVPVHGILGSDFFNSFKVKIRYGKRKISFYNFDVPLKKLGSPLPVELQAGKPYADFVLSKEDGSSDTLSLLIDTGAGHAVSLDLSDTLNRIQPEKTIPANLGVGLSGPIEGYLGRLKFLSFSDFKIKEILTAFPHYTNDELRSVMTLQNGSVGGELLKRFTIVFDYSQQMLYLKKGRGYRASFEYDMAGIELYAVNQDGKMRYFVNQIEDDSPAHEQGFRVDDEILFINFRGVQHNSLDEMYGYFKKESRSGLIIQLRRGDKMFFKFLDLKKRI